MDEEIIIKLLYDWNFWEDKKFRIGIIRKKYINEILKYLDSNYIIDIIGPRRAGKSTIMRQLIYYLVKKKLVNKYDILFINLDDYRISEDNVKILEEIFEIYNNRIKRGNKITYLFIDEINKIKNWEKFIRTLYELNKAKIIISGSTSNLLKGELSTLLTGRHLDIEVFPLSFREFLKFKGFKIKDKNEIIAREDKIKKLLFEYIEFGGFPEVVLAKDKLVKKKILLQLYEDIILRDVIERYRIKNIENVKKIALYYITNITNLVDYNSVEKNLNINRVFVNRISNYLQDSYLIFFNKMISKKIKNMEKAPRKVYTIDTGLANIIGLRFSENIGPLIENLVSIELLRRYKKNLYEIYYWKEYGKSEGKEVDFVIKKGENIVEILEVSYIKDKDELDKKKINSLIKASNELSCNNLLIISWDYEDNLKIDNKEIKVIPLWKWLLNI